LFNALVSGNRCERISPAHRFDFIQTIHIQTLTGYGGVVEHRQTVTFAHVDHPHFAGATIVQQQRSPGVQLFLSRLGVRLYPARMKKNKNYQNHIETYVHARRERRRRRREIAYRGRLAHVKNGGKLYCHGHCTSAMSARRTRTDDVSRKQTAKNASFRVREIASGRDEPGRQLSVSVIASPAEVR